MAQASFAASNWPGRALSDDDDWEEPYDGEDAGCPPESLGLEEEQSEDE